jgi:hypothetical protein
MPGHARVELVQRGGDPGVGEPPGAVGDVGVQDIPHPGPPRLDEGRPGPLQHVGQQVTHLLRTACERGMDVPDGGSSVATRAGGVARTRSSSASTSVNGLSGAGARKSGW